MAENIGMQKIILPINRLQETFKKLNVHMDIDLPQIAVVGIQSSGKSSVLEKFVGRDFLPRGTGIVTRRPLILQLIHSNVEYVKFDHLETRFTDYAMVMREIQAETDRLTGKSSGISNVPIILKVYSPSVLNLTLIDLPGITKVPIGDQPSDIEHQIRSMIFEYIVKETCLILAVTPATIDLANSEALKVAREVDPQGKRTIGVITKLDLMDEGTNALDILENRQFPLERGYVGVVNRSQKNIDNKQDMKTAAELEMKFFRSHQAYRHLASRMGTAHLQEVLNKQLAEHIVQSLPEMKKKMRKVCNEIDEELKDYNTESSVKVLNEILGNVKKDFQNEMGGHGPLVTKDEHDLTFGTQIKQIFHDILTSETFSLNFSPTGDNEIIKDIEIAIRNATGMYTSVFVPEKALDHVIITYIAKIKEPIVKHVDRISIILQKVVQKYTQKLVKYPRLRQELQKMLFAFILERENVCKERLVEMVDCEMAYINKIHEDFKTIKKNEEEKADVNGDGEGNGGGSSQPTREAPRFVCRGYMQINKDPDAFFALSTEALFIYKSEDQRDGIISVTQLNFLSLTEYDKRRSFKLSVSGGKLIYKDQTAIRLTCATNDIAKSWVEKFEQVGVGANQNTSSMFHFSLNDRSESVQIADSQRGTLKRPSREKKPLPRTKASQDVETIRNLVESYITIVTKALRDRIPKAITFLFINKLSEFLDTSLVSYFYENDLVEVVMARSDFDKERFEKLVAMRGACQEALKVIDDQMVSLNTT